MQLRQLLILIVLVVSQSATAKLDTPLTPDTVVGEYLVKADASNFKTALDSSGFQYVEELPFGFHLVRDRESRESTAAFDELTELGVTESQPNFIRRIAAAPADHDHDRSSPLDLTTSRACPRSGAPADLLGLRKRLGARDAYVAEQVVAQVSEGAALARPLMPGQQPLRPSHEVASGGRPQRRGPGCGAEIAPRDRPADTCSGRALRQ